MEPSFDSVIRPARLDDVAALSALAAVTFHEAYDALARRSDLDAYIALRYDVASLASELVDPLISTWLALRGDAAVGFLQLVAGTSGTSAVPPEVQGRNPLKLSRLYLRTSAHGIGLGQRFMELSLRFAAERGHDSIWLSVWDKNPRALRFYEGWGFSDIGWEIFPTGEERSIDRLMERKI